MKRSRDEEDDDEQMSVSPTNEELNDPKRLRFNADHTSQRPPSNHLPHTMNPTHLPPLSIPPLFVSPNIPTPSSNTINHEIFQVPTAPAETNTPEKVLDRMIRQLDLDQKTRDNCMAKDEIYIKIGIIIWAVRKIDAIERSKRDGQHRANLFHISRCIRALGTFVPKFRSPEFYLSTEMTEFFKHAKHVVDTIKESGSSSSYDALEKALHETAMVTEKLVSCFKLFRELIHVLIKSDQMSGSAFFNDFTRISWALFLYCRELMLENDFEDERLKSLCILVVLFTTSQLPVNMRAEIQIVGNLLKSKSPVLTQWELPHPDADPSKNDWIGHFDHVKHAMCLGLGIPETEFVESCSKFHITIQTLKYQSCLTSDSDDVLTPHIPWKLYVKAFDTGAGGLLYSNMQTIQRLYAAKATERGYEVDFTAIRPAVGSVSATPLRFARTPRSSVLKSSSKNLMGSFSKASGLSRSMKATPLSCPRPNGLSSPSIPVDLQAVQEKLSNYFRGAPSNADPYLNEIQLSEANIRDSIQSRIDRIMENLRRKLPTSRFQLELAIKMYLQILLNLTKTENRPKENDFLKLLADSSFHRCLMTLTFQSIFYVFKISGVTFKDLITTLDVHLADLSLMIGLVIDGEKWIPHPIIKKLKEIEERILESELWTDHSFQQFLRSLDTTSSNVPSTTGAFGPVKPTVISSQVGRLYLSIKQPDVYQSFISNEKAASRDEQNAFHSKPFESLYNQSCEMSLLRLHNVCDRLQASPSLRNKAVSIFEIIIRRESHLRLIANRHLDVIISCCIFAAGRSTDRPKLLFKDIYEAYKSQPQFLDDSFTEIHMDGQNKVEIVKFYNLEFSAKYRLFEKALSSNIMPQNIPSTGSVQLNANSQNIPPVQFQIPAIPPHLQVHCKPNAIGMTPITKKLYNHTESPFRLPTSSPQTHASTRKRLNFMSGAGRPPRPPGC